MTLEELKDDAYAAAARFHASPNCLYDNLDEWIADVEWIMNKNGRDNITFEHLYPLERKAEEKLFLYWIARDEDMDQAMLWKLANG